MKHQRNNWLLQLVIMLGCLFASSVENIRAFVRRDISLSQHSAHDASIQSVSQPEARGRRRDRGPSRVDAGSAAREVRVRDA